MKKITLLFLCFAVFFSGRAQNTCANAGVASVGLTSVGTINGTVNNGCSWDNAGTFGEWYAYTASIDGVATVSSNLAQNDGILKSEDTRLSIFSGTCTDLICLGGADDVSDTNFLTTATFAVENGTTYYLHWDDFWSDLPFDFEITESGVTCDDGFLPFSDDFSDPNTFLVCWDSIDSDGDGQGWSVVDYDLNDDSIPDGDPTLASASWNDSPLTPDNWVISQAFDLSGLSSNDDAELSWDARGLDVDFADENYTVYVATGNQISDFISSSTSFNEIVGQNGGVGVFVNRTLDISSFAGESSVYFAFRHHNVTDQFVLNIDNIAINQTLGLSDFEANTITHYYDKKDVTLHLSSNNAVISNVEIYSILGQKIISLSPENSTAAINVSNLNDGVYLAKVNINGNSKTIKFVKN